MTLNTGQYLAPLNSQQVLSGYVQGVKQGTGLTIQPDGTITLNTAGASSLGFLVSSSAPAPVFNWSTAPGTNRSVLMNDGLGNVTWFEGYTSVVPVTSTFPHAGASVMPVGGTASRPAAQEGLLRYNSDFNRLEFNNGTAWLPVSPASGGVFSFVSSATPTANATGDLWLDLNTNQAKVWDGVTWVPTSPLATTTVPGRVKIGSNVQIAPDGTISILSTTGVAGGVSNLGLTTVTDNTDSFDTGSALSANQGRLLQNQINALLISNNLTFAGTIAGTGLLTYVTPEAALIGFTTGSPLPAASVTNAEYFVIVESAGGFAPPGSGFTVVTQGDWFLSTGTTWQFLNVGYDPPYATTTVPGIVELATDAETQTGTDTTRAITPSSLSSRTATETRSGLAEIATQAEANAGVDDTTILTPKKLFGVLSSGALDANDILLSPVINGALDVQSALNTAVYDVTSPQNTILVGENPVGLITVDVVQATETQRGGAEIATQIETNAGTSDIVLLTPLKLAQYIAAGQITAPEIPLSPAINGKTNVQEALGDAVYNITSPGLTLSVTETATGQVALDVVQATEGQLGGAQIATDVETQALASDTVVITPLKLGNLFAAGAIDANDVLLSPTINGNANVQDALADAIYDVASSDSSVTIVETAVGQIDLTVTQATETQIGGAEVATQAETNAGTSDTVFITPSKLAGRAASETLTGLAEIATQVEADAGTDDTKFITPKKLFGVLSSGAIDANDILLSPTINGNANVQAALADTVYDITSTGTTLGITVTATGRFNLDVVPATTTQLGGATLATTAEALAGTNTTDIITPDTLRAAAVYKSDFDAKGDLLSASANDTPVILSVGTDGQYLRAASAQSSGLVWDTISADDILVSPAINGNTNLNTVINDAIYNVTSANTSITVAIAATGLVTLTAVDATTAQKGVVELATAAEVVTGTSTTLVTTADGVRQATVYKSDYNAKGDLLSASANDTPAILSVGTDGQYLRADSTQTTGLIWDTVQASDITVSPAINGNTNLNTILQDAVYDITSTGLTLTITTTATGKFSLEVTQATETQLGGSEIATQAETNTGTDDARIVTPLKLRTATVYKSDFNAKGDILSASANDTPLVLPVGTNAQYLVADNTTATGLKWYTLPTTVGVSGLVSNVGITTITDNVTSDSIDSALSANMGKQLQTQITALTLANNLTFAGTINATGNLTYVTTEGLAAGFVLGSTLPVASATNKEYFVICEQAGTITPPGGAATAVTQGDWFVSTGAAWQFLNVGFDVPYATTTQPGLVELATDAETQTGTDTSRAITPSSLTSRTATETQTGIAELATQVETEAGTDDTRIVTPLKLRTAAVYKSDFNAKGDILSATANDSPSILPVGVNGQLLTADSTAATGLKWSTPPAVAAFYNLDDISSGFNGAAVTFNLAIGGVAYAPTPSSNIMVFLGGVPQIPGAGNAYTIAGSTITFNSAPPVGTTFLATTVK